MVKTMDTNSNTPSGYPGLMIEPELIEYLWIPKASAAGNCGNVVDNLKRFHGLPYIHISKQPLFPLGAIRRWVQERLVRERST